MSGPLNYKSCNDLDARWNNNLRKEWDNCVKNNSISSNPKWSELSEKDIQQKINKLCCDRVMKCSDPNDWFSKQSPKINVMCSTSDIASSQDINRSEEGKKQPHFGNIQASNEIHHLLFGVY